MVVETVEEKKQREFAENKKNFIILHDSNVSTNIVHSTLLREIQSDISQLVLREIDIKPLEK